MLKFGSTTVRVFKIEERYGGKIIKMGKFFHDFL